MLNFKSITSLKLEMIGAEVRHRRHVRRYAGAARGVPSLWRKIDF